MDAQHRRVADPLRETFQRFDDEMDMVKLQVAALRSSVSETAAAAQHAEQTSRVARSAVDRLATDVAFLRTSELERQQREEARRRTQKLRYALGGTLGAAAIAAASALGTAVIQGPLTATARAQSAEIATQRLDDQLERERKLLDELSERQQREWLSRVASIRSEWARELEESRRKASARTSEP